MDPEPYHSRGARDPLSAAASRAAAVARELLTAAGGFNLWGGPLRAALPRAPTHGAFGNSTRKLYYLLMMTRQTRAIAPALALLLLAATLPGGPSGPLAAAPAPPSPAGPQIAISDEKVMSEVMTAAVEGLQEYGAYDNPAELARVNRIGYELAQHADFYKYPFTFTLINMAEPNSMAFQAGQIFMTRGMLDLVGPDDDMLACVLGHEIGHVIKEHHLHMARRATLMSVLSNLLVAGVLISSAKNPPRTGVEGPYDPRVGYDPGGGNRVQGAAAASLIVSELMLRSYSRDNEDEADQVGQRLAAAAGYNPDGAERLWRLVEGRAPQVREYGYLQTHPFVLERIRAAQARKGSWSIQRHMSANPFRQRTQEVLVAFAQRQRVKDAMSPPKKPPSPDGQGRHEGPAEGPKPARSVSELTTRMALATWPLGKTADSIRLARLHQLRDDKLASCPGATAGASDADYFPTPAPREPGDTGGRRRGGSQRGGQRGGDGGQRISRIPGMEAGACAPELHDYGAVIRAYRKELLEVQSLDPMGPLPPLAPTLNAEIGELETQRQALYPHSLEVWRNGIYETSFLIAFVSNFPDSPEVPKVALALGDAYSRTGNETEAISQYLTAWRAAPESAYGKRAAAGLRNLTPNLKELAALQELASQEQDPELKKMARERLAKLSHTYDDVANGAEYLRRYPAGEYVVPVVDRLNVLADNLYGEVVLYQGFGDHTKAIERINKILTNAPLSPAAEKLRDRVVLVADKAG
jgi:Zn-dependent protease with chaperone function